MLSKTKILAVLCVLAFQSAGIAVAVEINDTRVEIQNRSSDNEGDMPRSSDNEGDMPRSSDNEGDMPRSSDNEGDMPRSADNEGDMC